METKIYLVRHAAVDLIPDDFSRPLSVQGREDVQRVTTFFANRLVTKVVSSPYLRAVDTIAGVAQEKGLEIQRIDDCRERKVADHFIKDFSDFARNQWADFDFHLEGGESLNQVQKRGIAVLEDLLDRYPGEQIVLGTHGTWLSVILNYYDSTYDGEFWRTIKMPDIFLLTYQGRELRSIENVKF